jgi:hypothetical protein
MQVSGDPSKAATPCYRLSDGTFTTDFWAWHEDNMKVEAGRRKLEKGPEAESKKSGEKQEESYQDFLARTNRAFEELQEKLQKQLASWEPTSPKTEPFSWIPGDFEYKAEKKMGWDKIFVSKTPESTIRQFTVTHFTRTDSDEQDTEVFHITVECNKSQQESFAAYLLKYGIKLDCAVCITKGISQLETLWSLINKNNHLASTDQKVIDFISKEIESHRKRHPFWD